MSKWLLTLKDKDTRSVKAEDCEVGPSGALVIRAGSNLYVKAIIASGEWIMIEREIKAEEVE